MDTKIIQAIEDCNVIEFEYDGELRIIEPHCHGVTTAGNVGLRAYQVGGYSSSGTFGWKMYDLGKAKNIIITAEVFSGPRPDYRKGDKGMTKIYAEL
jgi:hypothetical protein